MINKLTSLILIILISLTTLTSAIDTKILIKTEPFHNIILRIQSPTTKAEITSLYGKTNISGTLVLDYQANINKLDFLIIARLFGETVLTREFDDINIEPLTILSTINETAQSQQAANPIPIPAITDNETSPSINLSVSATNNQSNITNLTASNETNSITGFSISDNVKNIGKKVGYVFIVAILLAGLILTFRRMRIKRNTQTTFNDEINDIVRKLHEAEREIKDLRNKNISLEQAQKEFTQAREKLERTTGYGYRPANEQHRTQIPNRSNWNRPQPQKQPENNKNIRADKQNQEQKENREDSQDSNNPF